MPAGYGRLLGASVLGGALASVTFFTAAYVRNGFPPGFGAALRSFLGTVAFAQLSFLLVLLNVASLLLAQAMGHRRRFDHPWLAGFAGGLVVSVVYIWWLMAWDVGILPAAARLLGPALSQALWFSLPVAVGAAIANTIAHSGE